jgi:DNA polymerase-3 subunit alpha
MIICQTAYLKRHHPVEFMTANMNSYMGNADKVSGYIQFCRKSGIQVLGPDVNASGPRFTADGQSIRFGLSGVKNVGHHAVLAIIKAREEKPFEDLYDFCERVDSEAINKRAMESLIKAGALDGLPGTRGQKLGAYTRLMDVAASLSKRNAQGQISLFAAADLKQERPPLPSMPEPPRRELLAMEKEMTGVYISGHPLEDYRAELEGMEMNTRVIAGIAEEENAVLAHDGRSAAVGGLVAERRMKTTRAGNQMCFVTLEDLYGTLECLVFPRVYDRYSKLLGIDTALIARGKLSLREEDTPKLIVDAIEAMRAPGRSLCLRVRNMEHARSILSTLRPGQTPVLLRLEEEGRSVRAPREWACALDERVLISLRQSLGDGNVAVKQ